MLGVVENVLAAGSDEFWMRLVRFLDDGAKETRVVAASPFSIARRSRR